MPLFLIPLIVCALAAAGIFALSRRPGVRYSWLVAAIAALAVWGTSLAAWFFIPSESGASAWLTGDLLEPVLLIRWDRNSSSLLLTFASLLLAVILTDVQRAPDSDWRSWGGGLLVTGVVLTGLLAGSFFTLLLFMGLLDLVILGLQMVIQADQERINLAIRGFLIRGSGILLLFLIAVLRNSSSFAASVWTDFLFVIIFLFGFYLRLGILPLYWAFIADPGANRSLGSVLRLAPAGLALILLLRSGPFGLDAGYLALILVLLALPSILAAWTWVRSSDEVAGRSFFISAAAAIGAAAVLLNHPDSGLSWSLTLLLSGGILFLFRARQYWFILLPLIGFWGLTGLPLSPSWPAMKIYSPPANPALVLFILLQAGLIA
ncbi:MAG TPA: hypothetical protein VJ768_11340, partial [Anaerolineales bacterium]|nr:hypothetical protein [Anaerolineales bacterium]